MPLEEKLLVFGTLEYEEHIKSIKKYEKIKEENKKLETKVGYFLSLLQPLKLAKEPILIATNRCKYEIDVFAEFEDVLLAVECKSGKKHNVSDNIDKITANKGEIQAEMRKITNSRKPCLFILVYSSRDLSEANFKKAKKSKVDLWNKKIFLEYKLLADKLGVASRNIIFSDLLAQKKIKWGGGHKSYNCIVTKGNYKGYDCYSFQMSPKELLKIAYVHRRNFSNSINSRKGEVTYQRMIDVNKIKGIQKYLGIDGNSFPTPILLNFDKELPFSPIKERNSERRVGSITPGFLTFPEEYGYAWIIDGQHRLFGYSAMGDIQDKHTLNVIAFSQLAQTEQANLFVDINQNQKSIPPDYLWDLYTDIYPEDDSRNNLSQLVKTLNKNSQFFKDRIYIPSISKKEAKSYSLKINNIGVSFNKKIKRVYKDLLDSNIDEYYKFLDTFFTGLLQDENILLDWEEGDRGFICSNNGVGVMSYTLNKFYEYLLQKQEDIKHMGFSEKCSELTTFTDIISKAINKTGIDYLVEQKKGSSESGRRNLADQIILKAGEINETFKIMAKDTFLTKIEEDLTHEFKETFTYNKKNDKQDYDLFEEAILGTICAFINRGVEGHIYIGIRDNGELIGIDTELDEYFNGKFDKLQLFFQDHLETKLITKGFPKNEILLSKSKEDPLILEIFIPESEKGVCVVKSRKMIKSWYKLTAKKISLLRESEENLKIHLTNKVDEYNALCREVYQNIKR